MQGRVSILPNSESKPEYISRSGRGWAQQHRFLPGLEALLPGVRAHNVHKRSVGGPLGILFGPYLISMLKEWVEEEIVTSSGGLMSPYLLLLLL